MTWQEQRNEPWLQYPGRWGWSQHQCPFWGAVQQSYGWLKSLEDSLGAVQRAHQLTVDTSSATCWWENLQCFPILKHNLGQWGQNKFNCSPMKLGNLQQALTASSTEPMKKCRKGDFIWALSNATIRYTYHGNISTSSGNRNGGTSECTHGNHKLLYVDTKDWKQTETFMKLC